jgi:hypothetical protein
MVYSMEICCESLMFAETETSLSHTGLNNCKESILCNHVACSMVTQDTISLED